MRVVLLIGILCLYSSSFDSCQHQAADFCAAAEVSERKLIAFLDHYFKHDDQEASTEERMMNFEAYLSAQDCVSEVLLSDGYLRTYPPQKEVLVTFNFDTEPSQKRLLISITEEELTTSIGVLHQ